MVSFEVAASLLVLWTILDRPRKPPRNESNGSTQEHSGLFLYLCMDTHTGGQILIPRHFRKKKDDSFHYISVWKRQLDKKNEMLNIFQNSYVSLKLPNCTTVWSCWSLMEYIQFYWNVFFWEITSSTFKFLLLTRRKQLTINIVRLYSYTKLTYSNEVSNIFHKTERAYLNEHHT